MIEKNQKLKRMLVWLPAKLYELGVRLRVAAYEAQYIKPKRLDATTISIGNIAVGGTARRPWSITSRDTSRKKAIQSLY